MTQLGYTWYPQDWWTSETFKRLKKFPLVRYAIRELFDLMYKEGAPVKMNKEFLEDDFNIELSDLEYEKLLEFINIKEDGKWWIESIRRRITKAESARENGKNGGRPKGSKKAENNEIEKTQKPSEITQDKNPNNPPLEIEKKYKINRKEIESKINNKNDFFLNENLESEVWLETQAMQNKISIVLVKEKLKDFTAYLKNCSDEKLNKRDFNTHFTNWLKSNSKIETTQYTNSENLIKGVL